MRKLFKWFLVQVFFQSLIVYTSLSQECYIKTLQSLRRVNSLLIYITDKWKASAFLADTVLEQDFYMLIYLRHYVWYKWQNARTRNGFCWHHSLLRYLIRFKTFKHLTFVFIHCLLDELYKCDKVECKEKKSIQSNHCKFLIWRR